MIGNDASLSPVEPPADVPEIQRGDWFELAEPDAVAEYLATNLWDRSDRPVSWDVARLSGAAYVYRERATHWSVVAKFYAVKTGDAAARYSEREYSCTQRAHAAGLAEGPLRAVTPLETWRGILFLEYVDGLTLEDVIAVRRSRPGTLAASLQGAAQLLASLHTNGQVPGAMPDPQAPVAYANKVVDDLVRWGVLESNPVVRDGLSRAIERWADVWSGGKPTAALTHGDATTSNFIFPWTGGVVVVDWERLYVADPAADLGRLLAEVSHSIRQHGGSVAEAVPFLQRLADAYCSALAADQDAQALLERARFFQASSTLRIARNGWVSRLDRTALVAQALALLGR